MDMNEMRAMVTREIVRSVTTWQKLPELLKSGALKKSTGNWYTLKDPRALNEMSPNIRGFRADKTGRVTHVQIAKPPKKFFKLAGVEP